MIIGKTISGGKNLRSIITKLYVQVCAKIGGVPWAIDDLPFSDRPTMVVGLDCYCKPGMGFKIYSLVGTLNPTFSAYWSNSAFGGPEFTIEAFIAANLPKALDHFKTINSVSPMQLIVFRDGISRGQHAQVKGTEVAAIRAVLSAITPAPKLLFVVTNKTSTAKFFFSQNGQLDLRALQNPPQGTYLSGQVTAPGEFYLLS